MQSQEAPGSSRRKSGARTGDWMRALPWLLLAELVYLAPYALDPGGVAAKYIWDEHCVSHTYPVARLARDQVLSGFFPLWNQASGCGLPLWANTLDECALPHALLKYLVPFPLGLNLFLAVRIFIALTGTYALARSLGGSRRAGLVASVLFTFTGFNALNVNSVIGSTFVLPWCLYGMHRLALAPRFSSALAVALSYGYCLLGGNPQTPYLALLMGYGLYVAALVGRRVPLRPGRYALLPGAALAGGGLLALPQLLPFLEYLSQAFSHHLPGYGRLHLDPRGIVGVASPLWDPAIFLMNKEFFGQAARTIIETRFPPASYSEATIPIPFEYLGVTASFLLVLTMLNIKRLPAEAAYLAGVAIVCIGLAFGLFPFSLIAEAPPFNQVSNWRFTTFSSALAAAGCAATLFDRLWLPSYQKSLAAALVIFGAAVAAGMALVASRAGLPLSSFLIVGPAAGAAVFTALLVPAVYFRRGAALAAFAFIELFVYDRVMDRPLMPHPHRGLERVDDLSACADADPTWRFTGHGEVLHPSLAMLEGRLDFRSYEMIFPEGLVQWIAAANGWDHVDTVRHYMYNYYFEIIPTGRSAKAYGKASVRRLLSDRRLPDSALDGGKEPVVTAPGPEYLSEIKLDVQEESARGLLQHAPSRVEVAPLAGEKSLQLSGKVSILPAAWDPSRGDGVIAQALDKTEGASRLVYSRSLDPRGRPDDKRWIPFMIEAEAKGSMALLALPGPRGDERSDYLVWADLHDPEARKEFERNWRPVSLGPEACYENALALPRLRVAEEVETVPDFSDCVERFRSGKDMGTSEVVIDDSFGPWASGRGQVLETAFKANRVSAKVKMENDGTLILADTYYPGWKARINGKDVRIFRANCAFRAIKAPAGNDEVVFEFKPESFRVGLWVGIVSWLALAAAILFRRRQGAASRQL